MFGSGNSKDAAAKKSGGVPASTQSLNGLVDGTYVEGQIKTENDIRIDGKLVGKLKCSGKVIIGPTGVIEGNIDCQNAMIEGRFQGSLVVHELLQVKESAHIEGEVFTGKLIVQSGSTFNVTCNMGGQKLKKRLQEGDKDVERLTKVVQTA